MLSHKCNFTCRSEGGIQIKRGYKISISIIMILLIAGCSYYTFPRRANLTYNGIKYKIGDLQQQEQIKMTINGYYYKRIFAKDFFEGSININNESYPNLSLLVGDELQMIGYRDYQDGGRLHTYGEAFIGENFNNITICIENEKSGWNSMDGFMLSAPAKNRVEALEISNKLMKSVLKRKLESK